MSKTLIEVIEELESLIPQPAGCPSGCSACCGPQLLTDAEACRMGLDGAKWTGCTSEFNCALLTPSGCSKYATRPFICKFFGHTTGGFRCRNTDQSLTKMDRARENYMFEMYFRAIMEFEPHNLEHLAVATEEAKELAVCGYIHDYLGKFNDEDALKRTCLVPDRLKGMNMEDMIEAKRKELE